MADDYDLSRRKLLSAAGTIGAAAALGGASTVAFFSDEENFANNQLVAGELDLRVGWEEHYSDWSPDEDDGLAGEVAMGNAQPVGLPTQNSSLISVANNTDAQTFLNNTETEQYPNGTSTFDDAMGMNGCDVLPAGSDQSPVIIDLDDVKPGDFGEVTFAFSVCDNPGYLWLNGELVDADENGTNEPEAKDEDEYGPGEGNQDDLFPNEGDESNEENADPANTIQERVELLDETRAALWYDDGDNLQEGGGRSGGDSQADIAFIIDRSGSMSNERNFLEQNITDVASQIAASGIDAEFALVPYEEGNDSCNTFIATNLTADASQLDFSYSTCGGTENASEAILEALDGLSWRPGSQKILIVLTDEDDDGSPSERANALSRIDSEEACLLAVSGGGTQSNDLQQMSMQVDCGDWVEIDDGLSQSNIEDLIGFVGGVTGPGEEVLFEGTLREALNALSTDGGIPLDGDPSTAYDEAPGTGDDPNRDAFAGDGEVHYLGFAWYLPVDHANEIQSDSVTFDLGFYTAQERHNDGSFRGGMGNDGGQTTAVSIEGFPSSDDQGNSLDSLDLNFEFDASGVSVDSLSIDGQMLSIGSINTSNGGNTLELRSIGGNVSLSTDFPATVQLSGVPTGLGNQEVGFVFEPDDDSSEDDTDTFTT